MKKKYAVIRDTTYYAGDYRHPQGWDLKIETDEDNCAMIGNLEECQDWLEALNDAPHNICNGGASYYHRIAEVLDDDYTYQSWLDSVDWDGCPSPDGSDYDANVLWAEEQAYDNDGTICIANPNGSLLLVDLSSNGRMG